VRQSTGCHQLEGNIGFNPIAPEFQEDQAFDATGSEDAKSSTSDTRILG
jgi:hypothetical protein